jgi:hypothetical protein
MRLQRLTSVWTNLRALLHWWEKYWAWLDRGRTDSMALERAGWYFSALILQADTLFTSGRSGSSQHGAALNQLGHDDLKQLLDKVLQAPATQGGRPLKAVIHRMRNDVMVHTDLDFEDYGPALVFLGLQGPEWPAALQALMSASESVVTALETETAKLMQEAGRAGTLVDLFAEGQAAPKR